MKNSYFRHRKKFW